MYSLTQGSNLTTLVGFAVLVLNHFGVKIVAEEITSLVGAVVVVVGIIGSWYGRYRVGDLKISGARK